MRLVSVYQEVKAGSDTGVRRLSLTLSTVLIFKVAFAPQANLRTLKALLPALIHWPGFSQGAFQVSRTHHTH